MTIKILDRFGKPSDKAKSSIFLTWDNWNDFSFYTLFGMFYVDSNSEIHEIGSVKIGHFGQQEGERRLSIGDEFEKLDNSYFSLGQSDIYYVNINELGSDIRNSILNVLNDIAKDEDLFERAIKESVTKISLFRFISPSTVKDQFRRLTSGGNRLTDYDFNFTAPKIRRGSSNFILSFKVRPASFPPTNIHVLIGRNGSW